MDNWFDKYIEEQKRKAEETKKILSNTDYIKWLKEFTQDKERFFDDQWLYNPEEISDFDRENVGKLSLIYEGINKYAKENYIYPTYRDIGNFYKIKLDEFYFEIGILSGQGVVFCFNKVSCETDEEFIDFSDIMNNKKQENVDQINYELDFLANTIITTHNNGVPLDAIASTFDSTIKSLKEDEFKKLVRKK